MSLGRNNGLVRRQHTQVHAAVSAEQMKTGVTRTSRLQRQLQSLTRRRAGNKTFTLWKNEERRPFIKYNQVHYNQCWTNENSSNRDEWATETIAIVDEEESGQQGFFVGQDEKKKAVHWMQQPGTATSTMARFGLKTPLQRGVVSA